MPENEWMARKIAYGLWLLLLVEYLVRKIAEVAVGAIGDVGWAASAVYFAAVFFTAWHALDATDRALRLRRERRRK